MRAVRWVFVVVIILCLSPVLSAAVAEGVAQYTGCQIGDVGLGHCLFKGYDVNDLLALMQSVAWVGLFGLPAAIAAVLLWIVAELIAWIVRDNSTRLKF